MGQGEREFHPGSSAQLWPSGHRPQPTFLLQDHPKKSPEAASLRRSTYTPSPEAKRRLAAEFLSKASGHTVPHTTDADFLRALQDGVALCAAVNLVFPQEVKEVRQGTA